jgi:hypothetical protein
MKGFLHWMRNSEHLYKIAYRKYSSSKYGRVAILVAKKLKEGLDMESHSPKTKFQALFQPQIQLQTQTN